MESVYWSLAAIKVNVHVPFAFQAISDHIGEV